MNRTIGFEIETTLEAEEMVDPLESVIKINDRYPLSLNEEDDDHWNLKEEHCGSELTSPVLTSSQEDLNYIKEIIENLRATLKSNSYRSVIDRKCGLHVHIGLNDFDRNHLRNLALITYHFEEILFSIQPGSRQDNSYVYPLRRNMNLGDFNNGLFDSNRSRIYQEHFFGLNFENWNYNNTCEFRYAASTIQYKKLLNWIKLLLSLVEMARASNNIGIEELERNYPRNIDGFSNFIGGKSFTKTKWLESQVDDLKQWMINRKRELTEGRNRND